MAWRDGTWSQLERVSLIDIKAAGIKSFCFYLEKLSQLVFNCFEDDLFSFCFLQTSHCQYSLK